MEKCIGCGREFVKNGSRQLYCLRTECRKIKQNKYKLNAYKKHYGAIREDRVRRECLKCERKFNAHGKFNRLCKDCNLHISKLNILVEDDFHGQIYR